MQVLELTFFGNPILGKVCESVRESLFDTPLLYDFGQSLIETMTTNNGVGLAAPQVNVASRILAMELPNLKDSQPLVMCNPVLVSEHPLTAQATEGCLSMPGVYLPVYRADGIVVQYREPSGKFVELELSGLNARVFLHELDHLNGLLFINRVSRQLRREAERQWEKIAAKRQISNASTLPPSLEALQGAGIMSEVLR
jgi:peptide deformylase